MSTEILYYQDIIQLIPHRYPFLFIDKVQDIILGESAVGIKNVSINEDFFKGHFPDNPIMPGVLITEAMAQTACVLVMKTLRSKEQAPDNPMVYFMSVKEAKFRKPVYPGMTLHMHVSKEQERGTIWRFRGQTYVENVLMSEATFTAMIAHA